MGYFIARLNIHILIFVCSIHTLVNKKWVDPLFWNVGTYISSHWLDSKGVYCQSDYGYVVKLMNQCQCPHYLKWSSHTSGSLVTEGHVVCELKNG